MSGGHWALASRRVVTDSGVREAAVIVDLRRLLERLGDFSRTAPNRGLAGEHPADELR